MQPEAGRPDPSSDEPPVLKLTRRESGDVYLVPVDVSLTFGLREEPDADVSVNFMIKRRDLVTFKSGYSASVSVDSEWLMLRRSAFPAFDFRALDGLSIEELDDGDVYAGPAADVVYSTEWIVFCYYVDQSLEPISSRVEISYVGGANLRVQHLAVTDFWEFEYDVIVPFLGVRCTVWERDANGGLDLPKHQRSFAQVFDPARFHPPEIRDTSACFIITYRYAPEKDLR